MRRLLIATALSTVCLIASAHAHDFQNAHEYCEQHPGALRLGESDASKPGHARTLEEACKHRDGEDCNLLIDN